MMERPGHQRAADDRQTERERADIRRKYRELRKETLIARERLVHPTSNEFLAKVEAQNAIFKRVSHASEFILDVEQTNLMSNIALEQARKSRVDQMKHSVSDFCQVVNARFGEMGSMKFSRIAREAAVILKPVPKFSSITGAVSVELISKVRKIRSPRKVLPSAFQSVEELKDLAQEDKTQTDMRVYQCHQRLAELGKVDFFEFAFSPESFSETVENIFDISFLVKQNRAGFEINEADRSLFLLPTLEPTVEQVAEAKVANIQAITALDQRTFAEIVAKHRLREKNAPLLGKRYVH